MIQSNKFQYGDWLIVPNFSSSGGGEDLSREALTNGPLPILESLTTPLVNETANNLVGNSLNDSREEHVTSKGSVEEVREQEHVDPKVPLFEFVAGSNGKTTCKKEKLVTRKNVGAHGGCGATLLGAMSVIVWNARGLRDPWAFDKLRMMVRSFSPDVVFISETKLRGRRPSLVKSRLGFDGGMHIDSEGRSGGLILLWKKDWDVVVRDYSRGFIDSFVTSPDEKD
ncbi:hypothetical protein TIFTF001_016822 [Ficus carica]|uniref:Endonuclease/exonuclease/phosphatase domain-containing protein n=1 Tax=Ficus carica TaxID=3494 RepID=A0AA88A9F9_FICCA|nr:hypothetical protein TIFTF001_016822 [Ficus carica]